MRFVDKEDDVVFLFDLIDDALDAFLKHAAEHRSGDEAAHLKLHDMCVAQAGRYFFRLQFDQPCEALDDGRFADAGLADEHRRIRPLAVREDLDHLMYLAFAADRRRYLVLTSEFVERDAKVAKEGRQFVLLPDAFLFLFALLYPRASDLCDLVRRDAEILEHVVENASLVIRQDVKDIARSRSLGGPANAHGPSRA